MRANSLGAFALFLAACVVGLTSCSPQSVNSSNGPTPPGPTPPGGSPAASNGPHVYVAASNGDSSNPGTTYGFSVANDGQLTQINGFPLSYALTGVASGNYLFAGNADGVHIDTYQIKSDGSLVKVQSFDDTQASAKACFQCGPGSPQLADPTGSKLYATAGFLDGGDWNGYLQTFAVDPSTGAISYVSTNMQVESRDWAQAFGSFSRDDAFVYGTNETIFTTNIVLATQRADGSLSESSNGPDLNGLPYANADTMVVGTDPTNHLVAAIEPSNANGDPAAPMQLASFTINSDGTLTTTNTSAQMPQAPSLNGSVSPDGTLIAMLAFDGGGIQLYNFKGASPITALGSMLPTDRITQLRWDKQNHLYALSDSQKLYVYNVTSTGATPAAGSPHSLPNAGSMTVQP
jgi:6-phosphogluconolactonase (cycloisomerase 2 family)